LRFSPFPPRRTLTLTIALNLCALVILVVMACGGTSDAPDLTSPPADPTATTAPTVVPDPTDTPAEVDEPDASAPAAETRDWNVLGSPDAMVTVLDYSDFQ
jgi:hypothetical protein